MARHITTKKRDKANLGMIPGFLLANSKMHPQALTSGSQIFWGFSPLVSLLASTLSQKKRFKDVISISAHWFLLL